MSITIPTNPFCLPPGYDIILNTLNKTYELTCTKENCIDECPEERYPTVPLTFAVVGGVAFLGYLVFRVFTVKTTIPQHHANYQSQNPTLKKMRDSLDNPRLKFVRDMAIGAIIVGLFLAIIITPLLDLIIPDNRSICINNCKQLT